MQAFILCGGLGTRLRSVIQDRPKPMALAQVNRFSNTFVLFPTYGFGEIFLSTGYRGEFFSSYFGDGAAWQLNMQYSHETMPLGTGGALKLAEPLLHDEVVLVANGDSFSMPTSPGCWRRTSAPARLATLALAQVENAERLRRGDHRCRRAHHRVQ